MNEIDQLRVACPNCGKRLRVTAAQAEKRLKCPSCSNFFPVSADEHSSKQEKVRQPRKNPLPLIGTATVGFLAVALFAFLWMAAKSDVRGLREKATVAEQKNQQGASTLEEIMSRLTAQEGLVKQFEAENANIKQRILSAEQQTRDAKLAAKKLEAENSDIKKRLLSTEQQIGDAEIAAKKKATLLADEKKRQEGGVPAVKGKVTVTEYVDRAIQLSKGESKDLAFYALLNARLFGIRVAELDPLIEENPRFKDRGISVFEDGKLNQGIIDHVARFGKAMDIKAQKLESLVQPLEILDAVEVSMILDEELVGDAKCSQMGVKGEGNWLLFLRPNKLTLEQIVSRYGQPQSTHKSGTKWAFYGRLIVVQPPDSLPPIICRFVK